MPGISYGRGRSGFSTGVRRDASGAKAPALVVGLDCPAGLQTARIFAARGIPVLGVAEDPGHPCARTRVCDRVIPGVMEGRELVGVLNRVAQELSGPAVVVPCTDLSVLAIAELRAELDARLLTSLPGAEVIGELLDKGRFHAFAEREGWPVPRTRLVSHETEVEAAACALGFPCLVKPPVKTRRWERGVAAKVLKASAMDDLVAIYRKHRPLTDGLVLQEWIPGDDRQHFTCNCYIGADGEPLATYTSRKLRQWPPECGQGSLSVSCLNDDVSDTTVAFFRSAGHRGLGYLEFKRDPRSGTYWILEANVGRPTGRSAAAEATGVELLLTMYSDVLGQPLPEERSQTAHPVKWVHARRDLQAAGRLWLDGRATVATIVRSWAGPRVHVLWSWHDPAPFWLDVGRSARRLMASSRNGARPDADRPAGQRQPAARE